ncbi:MAG: PhzF family phenazine biosynthesis protein [Rhodoferax sp.]|nr:PhzF family phenazine biosynthesis protein [Rhodoferax sp.]
MQNSPFRQVDVFTAEPYLGNPVAVVQDGSGLSDAQMQAFARWTNLSETTFLLPPTDPQADYRVRIFTPGGELQFAGHPTLGSCHAWLEAGGQPRTPGQVVQQCGVGLVRLRRGAAQLAFAAPPLQRSPASTTLLARVAAALGIAPAQLQTAQMLDNGTAWLGLLLDDPRTVLALQPDFAALAATGQKVGVAARYPQPAADGPHLEVRGFAPHLGVNEDPVTGSLNASLAQWLMAEGLVPETYVAAQGHCLQRAGRVQLQRDGAGQVWVGGRSVTCVAGTVRL